MNPTGKIINQSPITVKNAWTPGQPAMGTATGPRTAARRKRGIPVKNTAFAARVIQAHGRVPDGDAETLAELLDLAHKLDTATQTAVTGLRKFGYSWGEIVSCLDITRQGAQQRWGQSARQITRVAGEILLRGGLLPVVAIL